MDRTGKRASEENGCYLCIGICTGCYPVVNAWGFLGYGIAAVLLGLLLHTTKNLGKAEEQCNTDKALAVAEAERVTKEALQAAFQRRLRMLEEQAQRERNARQSADASRAEAERRARATQLEIDRLIEEARRNGTATLSQQCLDVDVDAGVLNSLR